MLGEWGTQDSHKPHPDLAGPLPCGPGALSLLQFTKTATLTLAGGRWMDPWPKASCQMLAGTVMQLLATPEELDSSGTRSCQGVVDIEILGATENNLLNSLLSPQKSNTKPAFKQCRPFQLTHLLKFLQGDSR
ncbi:hypothetical protein NDU88_007008 [Pleurodeles waltl]|uniref:Uncharacterized protein n=1 Tax=Pleurodeles waltl TaxID=8319 RepID=A0AAV7VR77_PLEWA|nr:hypothetical protein NDU88_007008 [Pleurodeles waltl]